MDAHLLRTFVTVARLGSFSAAAAELQYTQAAVSQQIATLEGDLKVTLLRRRPVEPTDAGARLLEHAIPILLRMDAARADVTRMTAPPAARLVVAMTPLAALSGALDKLAELRTRLPRLDVTVRVANRPDVAAATARGDADLGLTDGLTTPSDPLPLLAPLTTVGVTEGAVAVILPGRSPARRPGISGNPGTASSTSAPAGARVTGLSLADLADARWIEAPGVTPSLADLRRATGTDGFRAAFRYEGTDTLTLLRLAAAGHGLTLLPIAALPHQLPPQALLAQPLGYIAAIPVAAPRVVHRVELIHGMLPADSPAAALTALLS